MLQYNLVQVVSLKVFVKVGGHHRDIPIFQRIDELRVVGPGLPPVDDVNDSFTDSGGVVAQFHNVVELSEGDALVNL